MHYSVLYNHCCPFSKKYSVYLYFLKFKFLRGQQKLQSILPITKLWCHVIFTRYKCHVPQGMYVVYIGMYLPYISGRIRILRYYFLSYTTLQGSELHPHNVILFYISALNSGLIFIACATAPLHHFSKYKQTSLMIVNCAGGLTYFVFPPIIAKLLSEYSWREATLFLGLCSMQVGQRKT